MCHTSWVRPHLATLLDDCRRHGAGRAIVNHTGNRSLPCSYAHLADWSARFAAEYQQRNLIPGDRVLLWGQNSAAWTAAFYGCLQRGILAVPLDAAGDPRFAARVIQETTPRLLVGDPALLAHLPASPHPRLPLAATPEALPRPLLDPLPGLNRSTPLQILFTSGTTAEPKGVVHTHGNVLASLDPIERDIARHRRYERPFHPLRFLQTLPLSHVFGQFMGLWVPPLLAAEVHYETRLDAPRLSQLIRQQRISVLAAVPRVLELMRSYLEQSDPELRRRLEGAERLTLPARWWRFRRQHQLLGWKFWAFVCGGATLPAELEEFWRLLGFALIQGYGMTETTALVTLNHPFRSVRGSLGKPLPGREVRVADDGEILVRGESVAGLEWRNGEARARSADEGWLRTGDLATHGQHGELIFSGRKSDLIVTAAGLNIHPQDLEAALRRQPGIRGACVFAYEGAAGPQPAAALILDPGCEAEPAVQSANAALADYQQIRRWLLWPDADFPRTTTGKIRRREVAARAQAAFAAPSGASPVPADDALLRALSALPSLRDSIITEASRLREDLHLDSLGLVELQSTLEQHFAIELSESVWPHVVTVADLRALLRPTAVSSQTGAPADSLRTPDHFLYPRWPWSAPVRWLRTAFQECIAMPLITLLLAPRIERQSTLHPPAPMLIVANHVTAIDVPLVLRALPRSMRHKVAVAMAGGLLMGWRHGRTERYPLLRPLAPLAYWLVTALFNVFPLPQGAGFRRSFAHAGAALDQGMHVLVFPEGRRSPEGTLGPFQPGIGIIARESAAPVLPVCLLGLGELKHRRRSWFRSRAVVIRVAEPLTMEPEEAPQAFTARLEQAIRHLAGR